ncbi:tachykinin-like peptides receptor 86C [Physella acuta]|uniref:tachykinin-like peptides receptor 86C n=1 Tax=Physella acuta TaxID=109671 RepID=UPI0027DD3809|nr:tachykinin-like peptides receptor 86C [Physella acuta]
MAGLGHVTNETSRDETSTSWLVIGYYKITSDEAKIVLEIVFFFFFSGVISVCGTVANVINIVVFLKQGFSDAVNISLLGLAVADLGSLLTLIWMSVCFSPWFHYSDIPLDAKDIQYLTAGWPHVCFARITSWITAFITFERCLCIALPLKVKHIITPRRTFYTVFGIFLLMFACVTPVFCVISIGPKYFAERNRTVLGLVYATGGPDVENISFSITVIAQLTSFVLVILCTIILIHNLLLKSRWRQTATSDQNNKNSLSTRDKRVVVMVTSISSIFIACFLPSAVNLILMIHFSPDYSVVGREQNTFLVSWSILNTLEATSSTVNILVYYHMSSKFRLYFWQLFGRNGTDGIARDK